MQGVDFARALRDGLEFDIQADHVIVIRAAADAREAVIHLGEFLFEHGLHLTGFFRALIQRCADWRFEFHIHFRIVALWHELGADDRYDHQADDKGRGGNQQRHDAVFERQLEHFLISVTKGLHLSFKPNQYARAGTLLQRSLRIGIVPFGREHRIKCEGYEHRQQHGDCHGDAELVEKLADGAIHVTDRDKYRDDTECRGQYRQADFLRALKRRVVMVFSHLHVAHDVFAHDDGIVNQQPDRERERHQGQVVDAVTEHIHETKRADDRNRQRDRGDDRAAP